MLAAAHEPAAACVLVGDMNVLAKAAALRGVDPARLFWVPDRPSIEALAPGQIGVYAAATQMKTPCVAGRPSREGGAAQFAWINEAAALVKRGQADVLVTGPVSKHAVAMSDAPKASGFRGHTEHLAELFSAREVVMVFWSAKLSISLVTTHLPLAEVPASITPAAVSQSTYWLAILLYWMGISAPRLSVASLNPHAGEGGLLGHEESDRIVPGIKRAAARIKRKGLKASIFGPAGAETVFRRAAAGEFDGVVAMYHDQGTVPSKLLHFGEAVNITMGLPIVRTSVDHGTAYDAAGTGKADAKAMQAALLAALKLHAGRFRERS